MKATRAAPMDLDIIHIERPEGPASSGVAHDRGDGSDPEVADPPSGLRRSSKRWWVIGVVVALIVAAAIGDRWRTNDEAVPVATTVPTSTQPPPALSVAVFDAILPSTVTIVTGGFDGSMEGIAEEDAVTALSGLGTGVVVNADGLILTALHVVADASAIEVRFADGATTTAQLISADPENDIALLAPDALPGIVVPAVLGDPGALRIGDEAYVVGHPGGLIASMSAGVISGLDRSSTAAGSDLLIDGLIQFDAAVNPGNSGGPLLNRRGEVVGIVTGLVNPTGAESFSGIGLATTITAAGGGLAPGQ